MATNKKSRFGWQSLLLLVVGALVPGCYAEATTTGVVRAEYVPAHVEVYPREYYDGHVVYLIGDRWYYRDGPHWVYYTREPVVLVQRRTVIRRGPVVRERPYVHRAPPARYERQRSGRDERGRERKY